MAKDPAFLFYPGDWLGGTMTFSRSHKGAYMDLLMCQFNHGHMDIEDIKTILGSDYNSMWESKLKSKFIQDENKKYFNQKLDNESLKRKHYTKSRKDNLSHIKDHMDTHMSKHMENENENRDKDLNVVGINERRKNFYKDIGIKFSDKYPKEMLIAFCNYWTEHNEGAKKMKFEMQKVFNMSMRLVTWNNNNKNFKNGNRPAITQEGLVDEYRKRVGGTGG